jgi:hypothetical protein
MRLQAVPDIDRYILRRGNHTIERRDFAVQEAVIVGIHHLAVQHVSLSAFRSSTMPVTGSGAPSTVTSST